MALGPERRFGFLTVALSLSLAFVLGACGDAAESTRFEPSAGVDVKRSSPGPSCIPQVTLTERAGEPLAPIECPAGFAARDRNSALPMSGRFTSARELVEAFCTAPEGAGGGEASIDVDFETHDVIAVAYDGDVGLFRRAGELWLRHVETSCEDDAPRGYGSALFVVTKGAEPLEQYCSMACE